MAKKYSSENKAPVSAMQYTASEPPMLGKYGIISVVVLCFILSLAGSMDNVLEKWTGLAAAAALLGLLIASKKAASLKNYITPLFFSLIGYIVWGGISTFYAASRKFAVFEFSKLLIALFIYMTVLFFISPDQAGFRRISAIIASIGGFFGIISVDAASSGILSGLFKSIFGVFTGNFGASIYFEQGIRINGIFGNANTYAGFMALAVILSLSLAVHASTRKNKMFASVLLGINSLSYLLAFSMGSLVMFLIACLIMIASEEKGHRISLFLLMLETAVLTFLFAFIAMVGLGKTGTISLLPDLTLLLNAAVLLIADLKLRSALAEKMNANSKIFFSTIVIVILLIPGYLAASLLVPGDLSLTANESIMRGLYIPSGEYSLEVKSSSPVGVSIESQNNYDLMRHSSTILYSGSNDQAISFIVPKDSKIVQVHFSSGEGNVSVTNAGYKGTRIGTIHLGYPLLPEFIANRIQNLLANENVVQRTIFFEDGLKLFARSPVIGRGLGGFESGVYSVQSFNYVTKYTHNHYIQALCDLGAVGFLIFLSVLAFSVIAVIKAKKQGHAVYAIPAAASCLVQIFGQAMVDAVWSTTVFLSFSAAILGLVTIFFTKPLPVKEASAAERIKSVEKIALIIFTGLFVVLISGNLYAQAQAKAGVKDFDEIKRLIVVDRFENNDYKLSYLIYAPQSNSKDTLAQADIYADQLAKVESNSLTPYLMDFKFKTYADYDAYEIAKKGLKNNRSNPAMWSKVFDVLESHVDPVGVNVNDAADRLKNGKYYIDGVVELYQALVDRNSKSLDDITLSPENNAFIGKCLEIQATHLYTVDWVFTTLMTNAFDSACPVDVNQDGLPDNLSVLSGSVKEGEMHRLLVSQNTAIELKLYHKLHGKYRFNIEATEPMQGLTIMLNGAPQEVLYDGEDAYIELNLEDNSNRDLSVFAVVFPSPVEIKAITYMTQLEL